MLATEDELTVTTELGMYWKLKQEEHQERAF